MENVNVKSTISTVAKINNVEILLIENGEKRVAIRPICHALGISPNGQIEKIKTDPLLGSVSKPILSTGADEKQYEMFTIPFKFVFGWLFRIDSRKVKPEARESVEVYQMECYNALYNHFTRQSEFLQQRQKAIDNQIEAAKRLRSEFKDADRRLKEARQELDRVRSISFQEWLADKSQLQLFTTEEQEG